MLVPCAWESRRRRTGPEHCRKNPLGIGVHRYTAARQDFGLGPYLDTAEETSLIAGSEVGYLSEFADSADVLWHSVAGNRRNLRIEVIQRRKKDLAGTDFPGAAVREEVV